MGELARNPKSLFSRDWFKGRRFMAICGLFLIASLALVFLLPQLIRSEPAQSDFWKNVAWVEVEHGGDSGTDLGAQHYTVTIFAHGLVSFYGRDHVKAIGRLTKQVPPQKIAAIFAKVEAIGLWDLQSLPVRSLETPKQSLMVKSNGKFRVIREIEGRPEKLTELLSLIEQIADVDEWVGQGGQDPSFPTPAP
jgi:hypothetical protein